MSRIKQIVAVVNVSGVKKDVTMTQSVKCYDEDGDEVSQERIKLDTNKIKVKIGLSRTKIVPFKVDTKGSPGKGYVLGSIDYQPKHIEITVTVQRALKRRSKHQISSFQMEFHL